MDIIARYGSDSEQRLAVITGGLGRVGTIGYNSSLGVAHDVLDMVYGTVAGAGFLLADVSGKFDLARRIWYESQEDINNFGRVYEEL